MSLERVVRAGRVELPLSPYKEASLPLTDARTKTKIVWNARLESNQRVPV